ncbi:MAG: hypothetical protein ACQERN_09790 [Thermodesulfobacteriota bacterium]
MTKTSKKLIAAGLVLLLVAGALIAHAWLPRFLKPRIEKQLGEFLDAQVTIEALSAGIITGARLDRVSLRPPGTDGKSRAPLRLKDLSIDHSLTALLSGKYRITRVHIASLSARIDPKILDWASGLRIHPEPPLQFPRIELEKGRIDFDLPQLARCLPVRNLRFSAWQADAKKIAGMLDFSSGDNTVRTQFGIVPGNGLIESDIDITGFDLSALPAIDTKTVQFDPARLNIRGGLSGRISVYLPSPLNDRPRLTGQVSLNGLSGGYAGFPFHLKNGTAQFHLSDHSVTFRDGAVSMAGGSIELPAAGFVFSRKGIDRFWARADVRNFDISALNRHAVLQFFPEAYRPDVKSGTLAAGFHARWTSETGFTYDGDVRVRDISGTLPGNLPAVRGLNAEASFSSPGRVLIRRAGARLLGGQVEATGSFELSGKEIKQPHLEFQFSDILQKKMLVDLLPQGVRKAIALTDIEGAVAKGKLLFHPDQIEVDVTVNARSASLPDLPFRLDDPAVHVEWASGSRQVVFDDFSARMKGGPVEGEGVLKYRDELVADYRIMGRYLPLDNSLLQWLQVDMQQWRAGGTYDIELRANNWRPRQTVTDSLAGLRAQIDLRDVSVGRSDLGAVARNWYGHATLDADGFQLTNFRGELFGVGIQGSGAVPVKGPAIRPRLQLETENITVGPDLFDRLPFDTIGLYALQMAGQCKLQAEVQGLLGGKDPLSGSVSAIVHHLEMSPKDTPISASGSARVDFSGKDLKNLHMEGAVNLNDFALGDIDGDRLSAEFVYNRPQLIFKELTMGAYGGKLTSEDTVINLAEKTWHSRYEIAHVDFESVMGAFGVEGRETPSGVLRSEMSIGGRGLNPETLWGGGTVKVDRGRLYSFPVLVSVLSVLDLQLPSQSPVTDAYAVFGLGEGKLQIKDLVFTGGSVPIHMGGHVNLEEGVPFKQQEIEFLVTVAKSRGWLDKVPVINWMKHYSVDLLRRLVFQSRVSGSFADHKVKTLSSPVTTPIQKMWSLIEKITPSPPGGD